MAVVGAGGFLASRFLRMVRQQPHIRGVGIVRSARALARLSNFPVDVRVVNTSRTEELAEALANCDTVVNAVNGDVSQVLRETQTTYRAALAARCRLLVHLSSAVVFGRVNSPDLDDDSPPDTRNWMLYARGKSEGEIFLRHALRDSASMRVVTLRPGLIWGPGSQWSSMVGDQLSRGSVCLSNAGRGMANLIYVDNLVQMILAVHEREDGPSGFYNVGDPETVTWRQYYEGLGRRLGYPGDGCPDLARRAPAADSQAGGRVVFAEKASVPGRKMVPTTYWPGCESCGQKGRQRRTRSANRFAAGTACPSASVSRALGSAKHSPPSAHEEIPPGLWAGQAGDIRKRPGFHGLVAALCRVCRG